MTSRRAVWNGEWSGRTGETECERGGVPRHEEESGWCRAISTHVRGRAMRGLVDAAALQREDAAAVCEVSIVAVGLYRGRSRYRGTPVRDCRSSVAR